MEKIDFVIAWVDGNDPAWRAEKALYQGVAQNEDSRNVRYRDWDNLHYWFRAVEAYAPWVNRVHLVTWGHVPKWLQLSHPKLNVVKHSDYIPAEYLPTFSSHPIELNLHRIPGLADQFVYFNDDFFLTAPVKSTDFFVNGLPCDSLEEYPLQITFKDVTLNVNVNDILFVNQHFQKEQCRRKNLQKWFSAKTLVPTIRNLLMYICSRVSFVGLNHHHLPQAYLKSSLEAVWELDHALLHETCTHKFRDAADVSQCVFKFYQLASGIFHPYNKRRYGCWFPGGSDPRRAAEAIRKQQYKFICYNDSEKVDFETAAQILRDAFEEVLPEKSSFEI